MADITSEKKKQLEEWAAYLNANATPHELSYLVTLLKKQQVLLEKSAAVAEGGYITSSGSCPYCGKSL